MPRDMQTSFSAGELSPSLHSHADLAKYRTGLAKCENFFVLSQGGAITRPGFEYIAEVEDNASITRVIPFQFNTEQAYALVLTDQRMRIIRNGGVVLEATKTITGATQANPVQITVASHGYSTGDDVYIASVGGMTELNGRFFRVTNTGTNTFTLNGVDGTGYTAYTSGGTSARVYTVTTPWVQADLFRLKYTQSADVMTITHPGYVPRDVSRTAHNNWTISTITFGTSVTTPTGVAAAPIGTATSYPFKQYRYRVTAVDDTGDESLQSAVVSSSQNALDTTYGVQITWTQVAGAAYYNVYKEQTTGADLYYFLGEAQDNATPEFRDYNFAPDLSRSTPQARNPFNGSNKYPACVTYHQQRKVFASTNNNPQTVWFTRTADFDNMNESRPLLSDDSIEATLAAKQVNEIRHLVSLDQLIIFTSGGEWKVIADQDGVITPLNINFSPQGFRGCSHVAPLIIGGTALYVQEKGARVRDLRYTWEDDKYMGDDLTVMSRHLFEGHTVVDWCYSQEPYSIIWAVRDDGVLLSFTYLREHNVYAWAQHTTDGAFESVCSISEGNEDVVYAVVKRTINGSDVRYVERLHERYFTDIQDAFCVDSGLTYTGSTGTITAATKASPVVITSTAHGLSNGDVIWIRNVVGMTELNDIQYKVANSTANTFELTTLNGYDIDGTNFTAYASGGTWYACTSAITNLYHLEGENLIALADGNTVNSLTVSDGAVTLPNPAWKVHIGLPYNCDMQTLEVSIQGAVMQSRKKQVARVSIRLLDGRGLSVGRDPSSLYEIKERTPGMNYGNIPSQTAEERLEVLPTWTDYGQVYIRQSYPLPATVLAVIPELVVDA